MDNDPDHLGIERKDLDQHYNDPDVQNRFHKWSRLNRY